MTGIGEDGKKKKNWSPDSLGLHLFNIAAYQGGRNFILKIRANLREKTNENK